jgi:hypothetical protein
MDRMPRMPRPEAGLRALAERAPQAEAMAASWIECVRPTLMQIYALRRRLATIAVGVLAVLLFVHVMFGANGMDPWLRAPAAQAGYEQGRALAEQLTEFWR